jgi:hypothetical protein
MQGETRPQVNVLASGAVDRRTDGTAQPLLADVPDIDAG